MSENCHRELVSVLKELWKRTPQIDNGYCAFCRAAGRFWVDRNTPGPCPDERCFSYTVNAVIAKAEGRASRRAS